MSAKRTSGPDNFRIARHPPTMGGERQWSFQLPTTGLPARLRLEVTLAMVTLPVSVKLAKNFGPASGVWAAF